MTDIQSQAIGTQRMFSVESPPVLKRGSNALRGSEVRR